LRKRHEKLRHYFLLANYYALKGPSEYLKVNKNAKMLTAWRANEGVQKYHRRRA